MAKRGGRAGIAASSPDDSPPSQPNPKAAADPATNVRRLIVIIVFPAPLLFPADGFR